MRQGELTDDRVTRLREENDGLKATLADLRARLGELEMLADTDTLVPLPNRRAFARAVDQVIAKSARHGTPAALLFVDLDGLKRVNDVHGHPAGDAMLLHVARLLQTSLRATDLVARIGGDEFGLILDHLDEAAARAKAQALTLHIAMHPLDLGRVSLRVAVTAGLAMVAPGDTPESVIARADAAMYALRAAQRSER
jgi:diguanylate cyclase (GGDEF)-like protein